MTTDSTLSAEQPAASAQVPDSAAPTAMDLTLYCPVPTSDYQGRPWREIEQESVAWYASFDPPTAPELYRSTASALLVTTAYPPPARESVLRLITDHVVWGFFFDDHITSGTADPQHSRTCLAAAQRVLDTPECPIDDPCVFVTCFRDFVRRFSRAVTASQWTPIAEGNRRWLTAIVPGRAITAVNTYLPWRLDDDASPVYTGAVPAVGGYELSPAQWADPRLVAVRELMGAIGGIDNDLAFPPAEDASAHILDVLATEHGTTRTEAIPHAVALRDTLTCQMARLADSLARSGSPDLAHFAQSNLQLVRANLDWYASTARYRQRIVGANSAPVTFTLTDTHPDHDCTTPPPYPSIAWWWKV
ncbi:hypothetical protein ACIQVR_38380 [Streptomyces xanthochromogenes]|uniref:terpene synthase family protein n=1 Tax=Streptomyces xanthochromogenes TaxID=67384 RepID=UPI0038056515